MSPEELDKARVKEARRLWNEQGAPLRGDPEPIEIAARLAREGWTPPDPISPRVMAAREWLKTIDYHAATTDTGRYDDSEFAKTFLAGFAAAVKLAEPLVEYLEDAGQAEKERATYRQSIGDGE